MHYSFERSGTFAKPGLSSRAVASCPVPIGETLSGKYRIERVLGEGGMGVVVAAHHLELDQPVAIKFLLENVADKEEGAERFRREARAAAKIHSDHVVRVLDVGVMSDGIRYMVMEYLEGRDLAEELLDHGPFPLGAACGFILEAIDAVGHAHAVGIVHRDLKPANLFLAKRPDGSRRIKVLDFGISKTMGASTGEQLSLTKTSAWIGSPLYMAPEQMQSARDVDARADIWSLGAILYELIAGSPPYEAESLPQLCNLLITTDAPSIQTKNPSVPDDLAEAIMNCLVRDRAHRTSDVGELAKVMVRYATTITGSGMSRAYLDRGSYHSGPIAGFSTYDEEGAPATIVTGLPSDSGVISGIVPSGVSAKEVTTLPSPRDAFPNGPKTTLNSNAPPVIDLERQSSGTHAAWGATDGGSKKRGAHPFLWVAAGLLAVGVLGAILVRQQGQVPLADSASTPLSDADTSPPELEANALVPEPIEKVIEQSHSAADASAGKDAAADSAATKNTSPEENERGAGDGSTSSSGTSNGKAAKSSLSQPKVKAVARPIVRAPRPAPAVIPEPAPAPAPKPAPKPTDEFSDFGGRR